MYNIVRSIKVLLELRDKLGKSNDFTVLPAFEGDALRGYHFCGKIRLQSPFDQETARVGRDLNASADLDEWKL